MKTYLLMAALGASSVAVDDQDRPKTCCDASSQSYVFMAAEQFQTQQEDSPPPLVSAPSDSPKKNKKNESSDKHQAKSPDPYSTKIEKKPPPLKDGDEPSIPK